MERIGIVIAVGLALSACEEPDAPAPQVTVTAWSGNVRIWTDQETGCQYLQYAISYGGNMLPRLNSDGTPMCPDVESSSHD